MVQLNDVYFNHSMSSELYGYRWRTITVRAMKTVLPRGEAVGEYKPLTLYFFSALCISCGPLLVAMQNTAMKLLISMLNKSDCNYNNYWHIRTFLKVGFGLEFCLQWLALPVFGRHARRSTMKAYSPTVDNIFLPHSTQDTHITRPFDRRHSY